MIVRAIRPHDIGAYWPILAPYISKALDHTLGEMSLNDVRTSLETGEYLALMFTEDDKIYSVVTEEIKHFPQMTVLNVVTAGGEDLDKWLPLWWETTKNLAKEQGGNMITVQGRKGWVKKLSQFGFNPQYTVAARIL